MLPDTSGARRPSPQAIVGVLALLLGLQPIATDLYLPALPALTADLGAPMARAQLTLSALMLAFGIGQMVLGPLADRFGRRPVLVGGLTLYAAASAGSTAAGSIEAVVLWRVLQGIGVAAAVVCARAMVRDLYEPHQGARVMSKALSGLGVIALSSPIVGGLVAGAFGWRAALACTGLFAAGTLAAVLLAMPETLHQRNPQALHPGPMFAAWWRIACHPTFQAWALLTACTYAGLYTYLAGSSFVYIDVLGVSRSAYGLFLATNSLAYLTGTFWCRRWLSRHGLAGAVKRGAFFTLAGGLGMAALALAGVRSPWALALPQLLYAFGHGIHQPCGQAAVTGPFPANAGAAAALSGFMLAGAAFFIGGWLGVSMNGTVLPLTLTQGAMAVLTALVAFTLVQRHGEPGTPPASGMMPRAIGIAGPTASGKSAAALHLARALRGRQAVEIISVDSALVYRGMDIGTAKPGAAEQAEVPHHLIDLIDPTEAYSAARFVADAQRLVAEISARGALPLLVGGTMLYFKALRDGLDAMPASSPAVRAALDARAALEGWPALHAELAAVDPAAAARLKPNDAQRIQRALEVWQLSGRPLTSHHGEGGAGKGLPGLVLIALEPSARAWLHQRIEQRFDAMLAAGFMAEVQALRSRGDLHLGLPSMRCVGYRQAWEALDRGAGKADLAGLRERAIAATRQLAKRQLTWLRSMPERQVIACDSPDMCTRLQHFVSALPG